ncbi:hypothetical protein [Streptomyces sp. NPDC051286]|uniref:hypothetical protein n=1 Tax=Streptomyces sp. NPDC051286 TaxID=3365647 RepID=UPI0037A90855
MTHIRNMRARRMTVVGAAAALVLGVGGAIAVAAPDEGSADPTAVPTVTTEPEPGTGGVSGGTDGGDTVGSTDGGSVSGSGGGVDPSPSEAPSPTGAPDPTVGPNPTGSPAPSEPASLDDLEKRIDELDKKIDELPTKKDLADALRAFADRLEQDD